MQAHEEACSFIKKEYFYDVAFVERNYVWSYGNWEEVLTSLLDQNKCSFLEYDVPYKDLGRHLSVQHLVEKSDRLRIETSCKVIRLTAVFIL